MSDFNTSHQDSKRAASVLDRLAGSLGCPTEVFFDPQLSEQGQAAEFLSLWLRIENEQDRAKVLALLRSLSGTTQASGEPMALAHAMQKPE